MAFESTHKLPFLAREKWNMMMRGVYEFKVGTCKGLWVGWRNSDMYDIIAIENEQPGNGHLEDLFEWFEQACIRDKRSLRVCNLTNKRFEKHLVEKRGFELHEDYAIKHFKENT